MAKVSAKTSARRMTRYSDKRTPLRKDGRRKKLHKLTLEKIRKAQSARGVIRVSSFPHGFYEDQMKAYFSQFGKITRFKLDRSEKTGRSRKRAYIEFVHDGVAKIAADTMNNYLMFGHLMKCKYIPTEDRRKRMFSVQDWEDIQKKQLKVEEQFNAPNPTQKQEQILKLKLRKVGSITKKLADLGVSFSFNMPGKLPQNTSQYVIEIDSSDSEITFKTPPHTVKRRKIKSGKKSKKSVNGN